MAYEGLNWQTIQLPFRAGLMQKADDRARPQPFLDIATDVQFDESGGAQPRLPFAAMSNAIFGGGTLANCRRLAVVNGELCVFTDASLYSWNAQLAKWVLRAAHPAVAVSETPRFVTTGDQIDGERAELNGTIVYAWVEQSGGFEFVFISAIDKATGAVLMAPNTFGQVSNRPRLVALNTKILLFASTGTGLDVRAIDPADPSPGATGAATTVLGGGNFNLHYDVKKAGTQDVCVGACRRTVTTSYTAFTVSAALAVATSTKARTCDGPIAVSAIPNGTQMQVVRANVANIQGDLLTTATLADVFTGQAVGTTTAPVNQITACHRTVQNGGAFRCYAFWTGNQSATGLTWSTKSNWVDTANTLGTQATVALQLVVASHAFDCNGSIYVWLAFGSSTVFASTSGFAVGTTLQNSYFLYRDDALLCGKVVAGTGGGFPPTTGRVPGVSTISTTSFAWAATMRRRFDAGATTSSDFAARSVIDVTFDLDSNDARRVAQIGRTGYVAAAEVMQYDGTRLVECGFHVFPWAVGALESPGGSLTAGSVYAYKGTWRYQNGQGESERSTTATIGTITLTTGTRVDLTSPGALTVTHKTAVPLSAEFWRSKANPGDPDVPFFLITSNDPNSTSNPNRYVPNDPAAGFMGTIQDTLADTAIATHEANPENGAVLESLPPPGAKFVIANDTRVFLGGVAGDADAVWYSRLRNEGEVASFHDKNRALVPRAGGAITGLALHQETPTVFREAAIYRLLGVGLNNNGQGDNFVAVEVPGGVGALSQETVARVGALGTIFKSRKGWYLLTPGWSVEYIGAAVSDYDSETVVGVSVVETQHQVRILSGSRTIVWDYSAATEESPLGQWFEWTVSGVHSAIWNGAHVVLTSTGPALQAATYTGLTYGLDVETASIKLADLQGAAAVRKVQLLGEYRSACLVRIRVAYNYKRTGTVPDYVDDKVWTPSPTVVGGPLQLKHAPKRPRCESIKVRITAVTDAVRATLVTTALSPQVTTSGTVWNATFTAAAAFPGELGNGVTMSLAFEDGSPFSIDVRDHFAWDHTLQIWVPDLNNVGVRVLCRTGSSPTVAQLQTAILAGSTLVSAVVDDATPTKVINASGMANLTSVASFSGGAFGAPTGEAFKLTGLALEVGYERGLFNRLPAAQRQ